jgi:XTP/dITP diphosphohydrolase
MKIIVGTNNPHKVAEIKSIFRRELPGKVQLVTPRDMNLINIEIEENGETLEENARIKAMEFHRMSGLPSFADDTGLQIDALGGEPGVYSARFAGLGSDDKRNREKVLRLMQGLPSQERGAAFRTVFCYVNGDDVSFTEGLCKGMITAVERGENGFGYDPLFIPEGYQKTFAELESDEKNKISHRYKASVALAEMLKKKLCN